MLFAVSLAACGSGSGAPACEAGRAECVCRTEEQCDDGLACVVGQCLPSTHIGLTVSDPAARSCEVLLDEGDGRIIGARFAPSVTGTHIRQGTHSAVGFFGHADAAIPSDAIALEVVKAAGAGIGISRARCFDRDGRALASATVATIERGN